MFAQKMTLDIRKQLLKANTAVADGGVIAYPTESCFGLGCYPKDSQAVKKILRLKHRPASKGLILIGCDFAQLQPYIKKLPDYLIEKMLASWPAAVSWLVPAAPWVPKWLTGDSDKIVVRVPDHKFARELCRSCDYALVSTSANRSGQKACRTTTQVKKIFSKEVDYIVDLSCGKAIKPSTIIDVETDRIIR